MKTLLLVSASLLAATASAGVRIETLTRDIKTQVASRPPQVVEVQNGAVHATSDHGGILLKAGKITVIDDKKKTYSEMDKATMEAMAKKATAAMAQMQERMKNMTPEQRAQMEKLMGNRMPGGIGGDKPDVWDAKNLGTTATVEGRKCQNWNLIRNGAPFEELCVVPFNSLPGKEDMQKVFKDMAETFGDLAKQVPGSDQMPKAMSSINGYPVRTRMYASDGKFQPSETVMTKWVEESIPASTFEPPAGYTKAEMPKMPH